MFHIVETTNEPSPQQMVVIFLVYGRDTQNEKEQFSTKTMLM